MAMVIVGTSNPHDNARRRFQNSLEKAGLLSDSLKRTIQVAGKRSYRRERIQD